MTASYFARRRYEQDLQITAKIGRNRILHWGGPLETKVAETLNRPSLKFRGL